MDIKAKLGRLSQLQRDMERRGILSEAKQLAAIVARLRQLQASSQEERAPENFRSLV